MRKIKFRGKVLHHKSHQKSDWVWGMPTIFRDGRTAIRWQCSENAKDPSAWKTQSVVQETLGQFTGVYDCNGKEVYEGDIVLARSEGECRMCQVVFSERTCSFFLYNNNGPWYISADNTMKDTLLEIIGNIHDTPI